MKRLLTTLGVVLLLSSCSSGAAIAKPIQLNKNKLTFMSTSALAGATKLVSTKRILDENRVISLVKIQQQQRKALKLQSNTAHIKRVVIKLKKTAGKTSYVFSGASPSGWDCSGLVMWTYEQLGVTLEHRAAKQAKAGYKVSNPKLGDIVAFYYPGSKDAYHVGIYVGQGSFINAPRPGQITKIESIKHNQFKGSKIRFIRVIQQQS